MRILRVLRRENCLLCVHYAKERVHPSLALIKEQMRGYNVVFNMIDLDHIQFSYTKEEVDAYMSDHNLGIEDLLLLLIERVFFTSIALLE